MQQSILNACTDLTLDLIFFVDAFLWVALVIAVLGVLLDLISKVIATFGRPPSGWVEEGLNVADSAKLIDSVKGLVESLAKAPTWIAMFLGALALLWVASVTVPEFCKAPATPQPNAAPSGQQGQPATPADNSQPAAAPAGNSQAPAAQR